MIINTIVVVMIIIIIIHSPLAISTDAEFLSAHMTITCFRLSRSTLICPLRLVTSPQRDVCNVNILGDSELGQEKKMEHLRTSAVLRDQPEIYTLHIYIYIHTYT